MSSFDYERHIDEMMELEAFRVEHDTWRMVRELEEAKREVNKETDQECSPMMTGLLHKTSFAF